MGRKRARTSSKRPVTHADINPLKRAIVASGRVGRRNKRKHSRAIGYVHELNKQLEAARAQDGGDAAGRAREIEDELAAMGGLAAYQSFSRKSEDRSGFNSARWVVRQLREHKIGHAFSGNHHGGDAAAAAAAGTTAVTADAAADAVAKPLRLLDVGALALNYAAESSWINATAIDLNPQIEGIIEADFLTYVDDDAAATTTTIAQSATAAAQSATAQSAQAPVAAPVAVAAADSRQQQQQQKQQKQKPKKQEGGPGADSSFGSGGGGTLDVVCLCLVLNFMGDAEMRGAALARAASLLKSGGYLFLVLPSACVDNSRYCSLGLLEQILSSLGFETVETKASSKLLFLMSRLFDKNVALQKAHKGSEEAGVGVEMESSHPKGGGGGHTHAPSRRAAFPKRLIRQGKQRNNFAVVI